MSSSQPYSSPSLPPLLLAPLLGSLTLSPPSIRLILPPFTSSPFLTLQWWGADSIEEIHPSKKSEKSEPLIYPVNGGLPGLKRYLSDMKTLPLKLYTSSPIKYLGTGNLQIKHEGGSQIIKFFNEEEEVAEVKIEYRFDLGKYGDSESNRGESILLTGLAGKIEHQAGLEGKEVKGVNSFQLNEVLAATDNVGKLKSWPNSSQKKVYTPAETLGEIVQPGTISLNISGSAVSMKQEKHTKSLGRGNNNIKSKGGTPPRIKERVKVVPREARRKVGVKKDAERVSTSQNQPVPTRKTLKKPVQKQIETDEGFELARLLNRGQNLSKLMSDNLSPSTSTTPLIPNLDITGIVGVIPDELGDDEYDEEGVTPLEVTRMLESVGPSIVDMEFECFKVETVERLKRINNARSCNFSCDYVNMHTCEIEVTKLILKINGIGWNFSKILNESKQPFRVDKKWDVNFERDWPINLTSEDYVKEFKEGKIKIEVEGEVVKVKRKGGKGKRVKEVVEVCGGWVGLEDCLKGDVAGGARLVDGRGECVGVGMCRVGFGGGEEEGRMFTDYSAKKIEETGATPARHDTLIQSPARVIHQPNPQQQQPQTISSPQRPLPSFPKRPTLWLSAEITQIKNVQPKNRHSPITLSCSSGLSKTPKLTTTLDLPGTPKTVNSDIELTFIAGLDIDPQEDNVVEALKAKKSNLVIEVNSGNEVIGLTVLKLEGCANKIILPGTATDERPIKVFEGWMDVVCPFSKKVRGSVLGRVGVGLERQVERGFGVVTTTLTQPKEDVKIAEEKESPSRKRNPSEDKWVNITKEDVIDMPAIPEPPPPQPQPTPPQPQQGLEEPNLEELAAKRSNPFVAKSTVGFGKEGAKTETERVNKSASDLKDAYLRASFENLQRQQQQPREEPATAADGEGLIKHTLTIRPLQTCQVPNSGSANAPWGCYVVYDLTWPSSGSGAGGAEDWNGKGSGVWWDADSPLLNGTSKNIHTNSSLRFAMLVSQHELYLPTTLPFINAVCPRGQGVEVGIYCKGQEGNVKVGTTYIPAEDFQPGRDGVVKTRNVRLPINIETSTKGEYRGGDFLPSNLDLEITVRVEPKIVRVRRERAEAVSKPQIKPRETKQSEFKGRPANDTMTVKLGGATGLRELILLHTNKPSGCLLATFKIYCGADPDARWEAFTTPVVTDFGEADFNFETRIPVSLSSDWVGYVKSEALVVSLLYVLSPNPEMLTRGATVMSGIHANVPKGSVKIAEARVMLNGLLLGRAVEGRWKWTVGGETIGGIDGLLSLAGNELENAKLEEPNQLTQTFVEPEDKILIAKAPQRAKPVKVNVQITSASISPKSSSVYAVYQWDHDEGGAVEAYGTENCSVNSTGYVKFNDSNIVWVEEGEEYWTKRIDGILTVKLYERGTYPEGKITSSPYGCSGKSAADVLIGVSEVPLEQLKRGEVDGWYHVFNNASGSSFVEEVGQVRVGVAIEGIMKGEEVVEVQGWELCGEEKTKVAVTRIKERHSFENPSFVSDDYSSIPAPSLSSSVEFLDNMKAKVSRIEEMEREVREGARLERSLSGVMRSLEEMTGRFLKPEPIVSNSPGRSPGRSLGRSPGRSPNRSLNSSPGRRSRESKDSIQSPLRQLLRASREGENVLDVPKPDANSPMRILLRASRASSLASSIGDGFEIAEDDDIDGGGYDSDPEIFMRNERSANSDGSFRASTNNSLSTNFSSGGEASTPDRVYIKSKKEKERSQKFSYLSKSYDWDLGREKDEAGEGDINLRATYGVGGDLKVAVEVARKRREVIEERKKENKIRKKRLKAQEEKEEENRVLALEEKVKRRQKERKERRMEGVTLKKKVDVRSLNVSPPFVRRREEEKGEEEDAVVVPERYTFNKASEKGRRGKGSG
ncbi:hypothetical protein TL16_g06971 [Triparma laevis f. inornata]|uniref:C2CD3 N-terminal C2 domain-containing protein n=1 Tax=Triparma laevis f. inornata TaxID=1714386 RepID=A0A9W7EFH4_9STRA|nr:hypothetical protein TL16_g06971 [Triparma laevis f. inornata]